MSKQTEKRMRPVVDSFFSLVRRKRCMSGQCLRQPDELRTATMLENGYPKQVRILKRGDYLLLSRTGAKCHRKHFLCLFKKGKMEHSRLGITVSKKVGKAVTRNRIKRLCREFFRLHNDRLGGVWDINIIAKQSVGSATREQALESLDDIFGSLAGKQPSDK